MDFVQFLALFRVRFPEFADNTNSQYPVTDVELELFYYPDAKAIFFACSRAFLFLVAHLIVIDKENGVGTAEEGASIDGGSGEHTAETVGAVSVNFKEQAEKGREAFFTSTVYGRTYLTMRNSCPEWGFGARTYPGVFLRSVG